MKKNLLKYLWMGFALLFAIEGMAQIPLSSISKDDIEKGKIRIKLKQEQLAQANDINMTLPVVSNSKVIGITRIDDLGEESHITRISRVFPFSIKNEAKHRKYGLHLWFEVEFDEEEDPLALVAKYASLSEVDIAKPVMKKVHITGDDIEPVYFSKDVENDSIRIDTLKSTGARIANPLDTRHRRNTNTLGTAAGSGFRTATTQTMNDPYLKDQWHYFNDGTVGKEGFDIDLFNAWTIAAGQEHPDSTEIGDIIVAIVDGGIDTDHEDLAENMWVNEAELNGEDGVDDDQNGYIDDIHGYNFGMGGPVNDHSHGTHVAGTVAAVSNNGIGVAGVAGGDGSGNGVKLMSCQVFDNRMGGGANFAQAIVYSADHGAVISQNSWGYNAASALEEEVVDAIHYFIEEAGQYEDSPMDGGILFFAAGNTGVDQIHYPAALSPQIEEVIAVASTGPTGEPAPYSTHGEWVDISAPGGDLSFGQVGGVLSTTPGDNYGYKQGTSMATPHVSGVAALALVKFGGPNFTPKQLKEIILGSADPFDWESNGLYGVGSLNAGNALSEDERIAPEDIEDLRAGNIYHDAVVLNWTVPVDEDNFQPQLYYLAMSTEEITDDNFDEQQVFTLTNAYEAGAELEIRATGLIKQKDYWFAVKSADRFLNTSGISNILKVTTTDAPSFAESFRKLSFEIDVEEDGYIHTRPLTLYNKGEGIISWDSYVTNETGFSLRMELDEWLEEEEEEAEEALASPHLFLPTEPLTSTDMAGDFKAQLPDYYKDENTRTINGLSYVQSQGQLISVGSGTSSAGLILATRYYIPRDYTFNLTHINVGLALRGDKPVIIEIKKGKEEANFEDTETVYVQEYHPSLDTVNLMKYHKIPLYEPQRFTDDETFYVVLHFDRTERFPLVVQTGLPGRPLYREDLTGYFMRSADNGATFDDAYDAYGLIIPLVDALSSGDDGAYLIASPTSGEIHAGDSMIVDITVDATHLANGRHLASVAINTNDNLKSGVSIEVKTEVFGHEGEISFEEKVHNYNSVYTGIENELDVFITNTGLDSVWIYDVVSEVEGFAKNFEDTLVAGLNARGDIPFTYTPSEAGVQFIKVTLKTSIGDVPFYTEMSVIPPPTMEVTIDKTELSIPQDGIDAVAVTMKNTSEGSVLKYDLSPYNGLRTAKGYLTEKLSYTVSSSDFDDNIEAGQWDDIETVANKYVDTDTSLVRLNIFNFETGIPFYNQTMRRVFAQGADGLVFEGYGIFNGDTVEEEEEESEDETEEGDDDNEEGEEGDEEEDIDLERRGRIANGLLGYLVGTKQFTLGSGIETLYHASLGDREVFTIKYTTDSGIRRDINPIEYSIQVVFFRDGVIEYRYKDINAFIDHIRTVPNEFYDEVNDYKVGIQGIESDDFIIYREAGDESRPISDGLVIRFEPTNSISLMYDAESKKGEILPGETKTVAVSVKPSAFNAYPATYKNTLRLNTNTAEPNLEFDLDVEVTDVTSSTTLDILTDTLVYDRLTTEDRQVLYVELASEGVNTVENPISSVDFIDTDAFSIEEGVPDSINGDAKILLPVVFAPKRAEMIDTEMVITFANQETNTVRLIADGIVNPEYKITEEISEIIVDLDAGSDTTLTFTIENTGELTDLNYRFANSVFARVDSLTVNNTASYDSSFVDTEFGYTWSFTDSTRVFYKWEDLREKEEVETYKVFYDRQKPIQLPFEFPFYGELYDTIWLSKEGYVSVNKSESEKWRRDMEANGWMSGVIAPFFSFELDVNEHSGGVLYWEQDDRVIIQWGAGSEGKLLFQAELLKDGSIYFHYKEVSEWSGVLTYGIESPDETESLNDPAYIMKWANISDSMTVALNPPLRHYIEAGKQTDFNFNISAKHIYKPGIYQDTVTLYTNSDTKPIYKIPVTLNVSGSPIMEVTDSLKWENIIYNPEEKLVKEFVVQNKGAGQLEINRLYVEGIEDIVFYVQDTLELNRSSSTGILFPNSIIYLDPWESKTLKVEFPIAEKVDDNIIVSGVNVDNDTIAVKADIISSPIFDWDAVEQNVAINQSADTTFTFNIQSLGTTALETSLVSFIPAEVDENAEVKVKEVGDYTFDLSVPVFDSLRRDTREEPSQLNLISNGTSPTFATGFTAPAGGMLVTHIRSHTSMTAIDQFVEVSIHYGTELTEPHPFSFDDDSTNNADYGELIYSQNFRVDEEVNKQWIYYKLAYPVLIPEGQYFWVLIDQPDGRHSLELNDDPEVYKHNMSKTAGGFRSRFWAGELMGEGNTGVWKIRPLSAGADGHWITLDPTSSTLEKDSSQVITATISPRFAKVGKINEAIIKATTNDINTPYQEFKVNLTINGMPELQHRPNAYKDTLQIVETEELTTSYVFTDYEGEVMTITVEDDEKDDLHIEFEQNSPNSAKLMMKTTYESAGLYEYPVEVHDTAGNVTHDTVRVNVIDKNRPPVLNEEFQLVNLYMEDSLVATTFSIEDLFTDPDGDQLSLLAGNYTPQVFDMLLGHSYIDLHPIKPGVGAMVVAADDGKENGFVVYLVYVLVNEERGASGSSVSSMENFEVKVEALMDSGQELAVYPNPVADGQTNIMFRLKEDANVSVEVYDMFGRTVLTEAEKWMKSGFHAQEKLDISSLSKGLYFCRLKVDGKVVSTVKLVRQ